MALNDIERQRRAQLVTEEERRAVAAANQNSAVARIVRIITFIFGVLEVLLGTRVVLHMLGANAENAFANVIYAVTQPFVVLFSSLFANPQMGGGAVLELTTIAAMIVYAILAWVIGRIIWLALSRPR